MGLVVHTDIRHLAAGPRGTAQPAGAEHGGQSVQLGVPILFNSVSKSFRLSAGGKLPVFTDFSLDVAPGSFVAILGPSGSGKSTLLRMIAELDAPDAGTIVLGDTTGAPRPRVGLMLQQYPSLPWLTVAKNIEISIRDHHGDGRARERVLYYLSRVGLVGWEDAYPRQLSGGMLQRLALARTLAAMEGESGVVLLDEPLGALDALTRRELQALIRELYQAEPRTFIMVTHDVDEALAIADRVVVLGPPGMGLLYDSATAAFRLDRDQLLRLLQGTHLTFAAGTWSGYAELRKATVDRGSRGYDLWLGLSDRERVQALLSGRVSGAFFTAQALADVLADLTEIDPVVVHAFSRPLSEAACEYIVLRRRAEHEGPLRWGLPLGSGLERAILRRIDPAAFPGRITTYPHRSACLSAVARGEIDACISDPGLVRRTLPWHRRWLLTLRPLPSDLWPDLATMLVIPRQLVAEKREIAGYAVKALADDAASVSSRSRTLVQYFDAAASLAALSDGTLEAAFRRWGGQALPTDTRLLDGAFFHTPQEPRGNS